MKLQMSLLSIALLLGTPAAFGDAAALYAKNCASCHAKDGSGDTKMGKKSGAQDYRDAKVQASFSDAEGLKAIKEGVTKEGKEKMKAYGSKVSDAEAKELLTYIRAFKK
jgi:mono/diheme cytochrome c family protein